MAPKLGALAAATMCAVAACGGDGGGPPVWPDERVWTSAHFRYHTHADDASVCEQTLLELESHFEATRAFLGIDWPAGVRIDYFKYRSRQELQQEGPCLAPSGGTVSGAGPPEGCTVGRALHSGFAIHEHELAHAYLAGAGDPPNLLVEGVAEMLACRAGAWDPRTLADLRALGWSELVRWPRYDPLLYQGAVLFARHLLGRFGTDGLMRLYRDAARANDVDAFQAAVEAAFGETLDSLWNAALDGPPRGGSCLAPYACASPPLASSGGVPPPVCGVPRTVRSLELPGETSVALAFAPGMERATIQSCDGRSAVPWPELGSALFADTLLARLEAGRYAIGWERTGAAGGGSLPTLTIADPPSSWIGADCSVAENAPFAVPIPAATERLVVGAFAGASAWSVGLDFAVEQPAVLAELFGFADGRARLCASCGDNPATCQIFPGSAPARPTLAGRYLLTLPAVAPGETFSGVSIVISAP